MHPAKSQQSMIDRRYGMFIHFGINTFLDQDWSDGNISPSCYFPTTVNTDDWALAASDAGMKYVILTTKHHDGFCLWPTSHTDYSVLSGKNKLDVVESLSDSCRKFGLEFGLYYSLWDRSWNDGVMRAENPPALGLDLSKRYIDFMLLQLSELLTSYGTICEVWFDGGWVQPRDFWGISTLYNHIKSLRPECAVGFNWSIGHPDQLDLRWPDLPLGEIVGMHMQPIKTIDQTYDPSLNDHFYWNVLPNEQKEGYPIRYFPADFRLGDPYLPAKNDPKLFSHDGKLYYLPFESTVCLNECWFYNTKDYVVKAVDELETIYRVATANENIFILNSPPNRDGLMPQNNRKRLVELRHRLSI